MVQNWDVKPKEKKRFTQFGSTGNIVPSPFYTVHNSTLHTN
jgi:hypothetical protein